MNGSLSAITRSFGASSFGKAEREAPGRNDYTPAWRVNQVTWKGKPCQLNSRDDVKAAEVKGDVSVEPSQAIINAPLIKWSTGELPVDALGPHDVCLEKEQGAASARHRRRGALGS